MHKKTRKIQFNHITDKAENNKRIKNIHKKMKWNEMGVKTILFLYKGTITTVYPILSNIFIK